MRKSIIVLSLSMLVYSISVAQTIGIGTNTPDTSAAMEVRSNSKGMLIPRLTQAAINLIAQPAQGLMVYNITTSSFQYYTGAAWSNVTHSGILTGQANRVPKFNGPWGLTISSMIDDGQGISINSGAVANTSSLLDMTSTSKGLLVPRMTSLQRTSIGTPAKGLMVFDNTTSTFWFHNGTAWAEMTGGGGGSGPWALNGSGEAFNTNTGNVGINNPDPSYRLDVTGTIHATGDLLTNAYVGIGTTTPTYKLTVQDGSVAIVNSTDSKTWYLNYSSSGNYFQLLESGVNRLTVMNGGNVGIGTTTPAAKLDVNGTANVESNLTVGANLAVDGTATVKNGKGVMYNAGGATNLRMYTRTVDFSVNNLAPQAISGEASIGFSGFTSPPQVYTGNIVITGGTTGQLYTCELVIYEVTAGGCKCRIKNNSNTTINQEFTWNIMCIGVGN